MPVHALFPTAIVFNYHSTESVHKATLPARAWQDGGTSGEFIAWDSSTRDANDMIADLVDLWKALLPTTTTIDDCTIFTYTAPGSPAFPVATITINEAGTLAGTYIPATQGTFSFRDTGNNRFKFVLLDTVAAPGFASQTTASLSAGQVALANELTSQANAWQSRAGLRIIAPIKLSWTLNMALQQEYRRRVV